MSTIKTHLKNNIFQYTFAIYMLNVIHPISILQDICLTVAIISLILNRKTLNFKNHIVYASSLLLVCFIMSMLFNYNLNFKYNSHAVYAFFRFYIFYLYAYAQIKNSNDFKQIFQITLFTGGIFFIIGLIEVFFPDTIEDFLILFRSHNDSPFQYIDAQNIRLLSFLRNFDPNLAGFLLVIYQNIALSFAFIDKRKISSCAFLFLAFLFFIGAVLTGSRGAALVGVLSFLAMIGYFIYLNKTTKQFLSNNIIQRLIIIFLIILPIGSCIFIFNKGGADILLQKSTNLSISNSDQSRIEMFLSSVDIILEHPFWGVGMDNYRPTLLKETTYFEKYPTLITPSLRDPHDFFMVIGIAGGIPSIVLMIYIFYTIFRILFSHNNIIIDAKIMGSAILFPFIFNIPFENALSDRSRLLLFFFVLLAFSIICKFDDELQTSKKELV